MRVRERFIGVLLCMGLLAQAHAQDTFNRRYDPFAGGEAQSGTSVEINSNGGFIVFASSEWVDTVLNWSYSSVVTALQLDAQGGLLQHEHVDLPYSATYSGWANGSFVCTDGTIAIGGSTYEGDGTQRPALFRFTNSGMPIGSWTYGVAGEEWIGRQGKQTPEGGYVICGETSSTPTIDAFVIKTDASGAQQWVQTYGGANSDYANAIDLRASGGFFVGGQYRTTLADRDLWVQALNDTGGVEWEQIWGSPYRDPNAHLTTASDGHVLVASAWGMNSANNQFRLYLAKLDSTDGDIMWSREYGGTMLNTSLFVVQEVEAGGDLIAAGQVAPQGLPSGVLLRTTFEGDSLWMRYYKYYDALVANGHSQLRDVQPTADGGFIAVGTALMVAGTYSQDVWVIKTDSMGCIEPGCHLIQGMETQITNLRDAITVAPNPAAQGTPVQVQLDLPASFTAQGTLRLTVVSSDGRVVHERSAPAGVLTFSFPISAFASGLYHIHLSDDTRWISGAKLVVE